MKMTNYNGRKDHRRRTKYKSHGSYRAQRKPNSPKVKNNG